MSMASLLPRCSSSANLPFCVRTAWLKDFKDGNRTLRTFASCSGREREDGALMRCNKDTVSVKGREKGGRFANLPIYSWTQVVKQDESGIGIVGKWSGRDSAMLVGQRTNQLKFIPVLSYNLNTNLKRSLERDEQAYSTCRVRSPSRRYLPLALLKGSSVRRKAIAFLWELVAMHENIFSRSIVSCLSSWIEEWERSRTFKFCELPRSKSKSASCKSHSGSITFRSDSKLNWSSDAILRALA
jgi:hypothetical protein